MGKVRRKLIYRCCSTCAVTPVSKVITKYVCSDGRDFPRLDLGPNIGPIPIKKNLKGQNLSEMVDIIPNFLVLHFGENFMEIRTKIPKLQMHEILHKNMNENIILHKK